MSQWGNCRIIQVRETSTIWQTNLHPSNFGKTRKIGLPTVWQTNLTKIETWQNSHIRVVSL
jgi:hypothetical protein